MKFEIKSWLTGGVLFSLKTDSMRLCVEAAVKSRADLREADLSGAVLRGADLSGAVLSDADLSGAVLSGAVLSEAVLRGADLSGAVLRGAVLRGAVLREAVLSDADLSGAVLSEAVLSDADLSGAVLRGAVLSEVLRGADLSSADLSEADLSEFKNDFFNVLLHAPHEVDGLSQALKEGRVDGSVYEGECACLVGTIANLRKCNHREIPGLTPDSYRPAEQWFMNIRKGDTPEKNKIVVTTLEWIEEFQGLLAGGMLR